MIRSLAILILLALQISSLGAKTLDPLWVRAQAIAQSNKNFVASEVVTDIEVQNNEGKNLENIQKKDKFSEWKDGLPLRITSPLNETQGSTLANLKFPVNIADHPEQGLLDGDTIERLESVVYDGKACVVFSFSGKTGKAGKLSYKAKAWIDTATGFPMKVNYFFDGNLMFKSMTYSILYGANEKNQWLPNYLVIDATISYLFDQIRFIGKQRLSQWISRP